MNKNSLPLPENQPARSIFKNAYVYYLGKLERNLQFAKAAPTKSRRAAYLTVARYQTAAIRKLRQDAIA